LLANTFFKTCESLKREIILS